MLHLRVLVPEVRDRTAVVTLSDGTGKVREDAGVASAAPRLAAAHGNPDCSPLRPGGHPPFGAYLLLKRASAPEGCAIEYGTEILLFEAQDGQALEAESFGRLALLVYSGPAGKDALLRRTQGGVRLSRQMMSEIVSRLASGGDIDLRIGPLDEAPAWWQFWKPRHFMQPLPLSSEPPHLAAPPLDEVSLMSALLQGTHTRRRSRSETQHDDDRSGYSDSGSSSGSGSAPFRGGGGEYAGGGASGSWGGGAGDAALSGVDGSGRILAAGAGAAAGIAAAAAIAESAPGRADAGGETASEAGEGGDTGTRTDTAY
jgi:hypothetical protein